MSIDELCKKSRDKEFHCYGTTRIFEKRARKLKSLRTWITFLGIVTPVIVGGTVLAFGSNAKVLPYFLTAAGVVGLIQLILSTWSIVARWDETYEYSIESARENTELFNQFKKLADHKPSDMAVELDDAVKVYEQREFKDIGQSLSDKEKRFANRETLRYYQKPCHICKETPKTVKPSKCDGCGNF
jgi:mobilome CxxCx(11)CxxC protein